MISLLNSQDSTINTKLAIQRLLRGILVSAGQFSLLLACCNSANVQQQVLSVLKESSPLDILEIQIPSHADKLYTTIVNQIGSSQPNALMVRDLESVVAINQLIISANLMRDELRKQFQFPLVLWVNDDIMRKLVWLAPDLKDWAASTIRFDLPNTQFEQRRLSA